MFEEDASQCLVGRRIGLVNPIEYERGTPRCSRGEAIALPNKSFLKQPLPIYAERSSTRYDGSRDIGILVEKACDTGARALERSEGALDIAA
jgi:hypothetical protein